MVNLHQKTLIEILKKNSVPAIGCTEPIAVAYAVATARKRIKGQLEYLKVRVDPNIYKNGLKVGIPGTSYRGLPIAAALGLVAGDPGKGFRTIENLKKEDVEEAKLLVTQRKINIDIKEGCDRLFIEVVLNTGEGKIRVVILDHHLNIVSIEKIGKDSEFKPFVTESKDTESYFKIIQKCSFDDFLDFTKEIQTEKIYFLKEGLKMNLEIAKEGLALKSNLGKSFKEIVKDGSMPDSIISYAQMLCSAASEARMAGSRLPVMSVAGSGNHGIIIFLTNFAVTKKKMLGEKKLLKALALSILITLFIKSYTGSLSAMCGSAVAAGVGASAGVTYLLGGNPDQIYGAILNMLGSISGIICDGAKEGCAYKLALAAGWAVQAAMLSRRGAIINPNDGILTSDFKTLIENLGHICNPGMIPTNKAILEVISNR